MGEGGGGLHSAITQTSTRYACSRWCQWSVADQLTVNPSLLRTYLVAETGWTHPWFVLPTIMRYYFSPGGGETRPKKGASTAQRFCFCVFSPIPARARPTTVCVFWYQTKEQKWGAFLRNCRAKKGCWVFGPSPTRNPETRKQKTKKEKQRRSQREALGMEAFRFFVGGDVGNLAVPFYIK